MAKQINIDQLLKIIEINKKSELLKYCNNLTVHGNDFAGLINWADDSNPIYRHKIYYREIVPSDLRPVLKSLPQISKEIISVSDTSVLLKKLSQVIKVRRQLVGHMFHTKDVKKWHFFYFDQRDTSEWDNHWEYGSHVHLINHLWPNHDPIYVLKEFLEDKPHLKGSIHIRYIDKS